MLRKPSLLPYSVGNAHLLLEPMSHKRNRFIALPGISLSPPPLIYRHGGEGPNMGGSSRCLKLPGLVVLQCS